MPIIYILTNQSMPDTIKIGITDNLERRIKELDNTSMPLPFECYYAVEVENASAIERLHITAPIIPVPLPIPFAMVTISGITSLFSISNPQNDCPHLLYPVWTSSAIVIPPY